MLRLLRLLKNYKKECILGPLIKLIEVIFELTVPLVVAKIIDNGTRIILLSGSFVKISPIF